MCLSFDLKYTFGTHKVRMWLVVWTLERKVCINGILYNFYIITREGDIRGRWVTYKIVEDLQTYVYMNLVKLVSAVFVKD